MINSLKDHFIVCGFGRVGRNASLELQRASAAFLVIDRNEQRVAKATSVGMLAIVADATRDDSLREAGVMSAKGLIAALPSDAENLFTILSAKTLNPGLSIVTRASEEEAGDKLRRAGADTVLTPYAIAGRQLADVLLRPQVVELLDYTRSRIGPNITIEQVCVTSAREARAKTLKHLMAGTGAGVMVLAVRNQGKDTVFNPSLDTEITVGDWLIVMGQRSDVRKLEQAIST